LLRAARQNLFAVRWSRQILDEVARNPIEDRRSSPEQAANLIDAMTRAFPDAEIAAAEVAALQSEMTSRHGSLAAVSGPSRPTRRSHACLTSTRRRWPDPRRDRRGR